jgi:hypothetical protein
MGVLLLLNLYLMIKRRSEDKGLSREAFNEKYGK